MTNEPEKTKSQLALEALQAEIDKRNKARASMLAERYEEVESEKPEERFKRIMADKSCWNSL